MQQFARSRAHQGHHVQAPGARLPSSLKRSGGEMGRDCWDRKILLSLTRRIAIIVREWEKRAVADIPASVVHQGSPSEGKLLQRIHGNPAQSCCHSIFHVWHQRSCATDSLADILSKSACTEVVGKDIYLLPTNLHVKLCYTYKHRSKEFRRKPTCFKCKQWMT